MKKFFAEKENENMIISGEEFLHLAVLRCNVGEKVICYIGDNNQYDCELTEITKKQAIAKIISSSECEGNPKIEVTFFQGLPKGDKLELVTQKLTELGMSKIIPFESDFTVAKENNKKNDRLNKIAKEACKQCGRSVPLVVEDTIKFKQMLDMLKDYELVLFANEKNKFAECELNNVKKIAVIVGSEGGFSDNEIALINQNNAISIGLGSRILRCETATIALASILRYTLNI